MSLYCMKRSYLIDQKHMVRDTKIQSSSGSTDSMANDDDDLSSLHMHPDFDDEQPSSTPSLTQTGSSSRDVHEGKPPQTSRQDQTSNASRQRSTAGLQLLAERSSNPPHPSKSAEVVPPSNSSRSIEIGSPGPTGRKGQHRSGSMGFNPQPLESWRLPTIALFGLDDQKGITLNLNPTRQFMNKAQAVASALIEIDSCEDEDPESQLKPTRGLMGNKQASQGQLSVGDPALRDHPVFHVKANRRGSNASCMSDLTFRDESMQATKKKSVTTNEVGSSMRSRRSLVEPKKIEEAFPNHPHPAIEYPPLYFAIRRFPRLLDVAKSFFRCRWKLSYPLQKRIPCSRFLRRANVFLTVGELLLVLPFFAAIIACTVYSFVFPSVSISGHAARTPLIFAYGTAMRNSLLTLLLGIPVERSIWYHKLAARIAYVNGLMHTYVAFVYPDPVDDTALPPPYTLPSSDTNFFSFLFADAVNQGGTLLVVFITAMIITALPWVRQKAFEVFYYIHIILAASMLAFAFFHTGILIPTIGACTWGVDLVIRKIWMACCRYPREASVRIISDSVVEVCFPKMDGFDYNPGQYIFLAVPELSILEWHPFSLSSSPEQKIVTMHIRKAGSWTTALYELAKKKMKISVLMEGPYGSVGVDLSSDRYKMVMLFSGGIGVTPMQAICNQMMYEHSSGLRELKKLSFIWIERDPHVMQKVDVVRRSTHAHCESEIESERDVELKSIAALYGGSPQGIASTLLALVPASEETDEQLDLQFPSTDLDAPDSTEDDDSAAPESYLPGEAMPEEAAPTRSSYGYASDDDTMHQSFLDAAYNNPDCANAQPEVVLDLQVYLTARQGISGISHLPFIQRGRPDIKELFRAMKDEAIKKGEHRVAVCVCAPKRLVTICQKACAKYSDKKVRFDLHYEVFD